MQSNNNNAVHQDLINVGKVLGHDVFASLSLFAGSKSMNIVFNGNLGGFVLSCATNTADKVVQNTAQKPLKENKNISNNPLQISTDMV